MLMDNALRVMHVGGCVGAERAASAVSFGQSVKVWKAVMRRETNEVQRAPHMAMCEGVMHTWEVLLHVEIRIRGQLTECETMCGTGSEVGG
eukprot:351297-Chlamydomonas_euryale.AAC.8